ncbi:hypothetical protein [Nocardioides plantarum]|uniref:Bacterial spore germination immunoglobulin-like domain-containing protein n=1 Tax=Nocardioides plantarum TaxID=29299 RepID=A0ABV5K7B9_9ACTN|nr:hypothetical protein [Nocardioides plantarum]
MSDQLPDEPDQPENRALPVLWGVLALVAVAVIVGGVLAVGASLATKATGLASDGEATSNSTQRGETLYLPTPSEVGSSPPITLSNGTEPELPSSTYSDTPAAPKSEITLSSDQTQVGAMEKIYLNGTYPGGDGAVLQVQQYKDGGWSDFPVNVSVSGDQFSTFIQAGQLGENRFRVVDTDSDKTSDEVVVTIS